MAKILLDFFLWGGGGGLVYESPEDSTEDLVVRTVVAGRIRTTPAILPPMHQFFINRWEMFNTILCASTLNLILMWINGLFQLVISLFLCVSNTDTCIWTSEIMHHSFYEIIPDDVISVSIQHWECAEFKKRCSLWLTSWTLTSHSAATVGAAYYWKSACIQYLAIMFCRCADSTAWRISIQKWRQVLSGRVSKLLFSAILNWDLLGYEPRTCCFDIQILNFSATTTFLQFRVEYSPRFHSKYF